MKDNRPPILVVAGPTASGKSDLAIRLARRFNGEIISADSRQVYRGMDIGTGKVRRMRHLSFENSYFSEGVRHWLLDIASPSRQYSVARWKRAAQKAVRDIVRRGKLPIICGGTGFWIDALVYDLSIPDVKPDMRLRARLQKLSTSELFVQLSNLDPLRASAIDRQNPVRLIRALEIVLTTGKPVPTAHRSSPYHVLYLGVSRTMDELKRRIEKRLDSRLKSGMVAEVRRLHTNGVSWRRLESFGLEYRWVARFLQGKITKTQMRSGLLKDICAYAKRQFTWWRKNSDIRWVKDLVQPEGLTRKFIR